MDCISRLGVSVKAALDTRLYHFLNSVFCSFANLVLAFYYSIQVSTVGTIFYITLSIFLWFIAKQIKKTIRVSDLTDDSAKFSVEIIEHVRPIQLLGRERYFLLKYKEQLHKCQSWEFKVRRRRSNYV